MVCEKCHRATCACPPQEDRSCGTCAHWQLVPDSPLPGIFLTTHGLCSAAVLSNTLPACVEVKRICYRFDHQGCPCWAKAQ